MKVSYKIHWGNTKEQIEKARTECIKNVNDQFNEIEKTGTPKQITAFSIIHYTVDDKNNNGS